MKNNFFNRLRYLFHEDFQLYKQCRSDKDTVYIVFYIKNSIHELPLHFGLMDQEAYECLFVNHPVVKIMQCRNKQLKVYVWNTLKYLIGAYK